MLLDLIHCKVAESQIMTLTLAPVVGQQISGLKLIAQGADALAIFNCWVGRVLCSLAAQPTNPEGVTKRS